MHPPDVRKTTFMTPHGLYCHNVMPLRLENVRATYQRLVSKIFRPLLGNTMEAYINDMLVKSRERFDHIQHLQEAFELLQRYDMKLNPLKCVFRVSLGKFLGFMVIQRGIEANPVQLKAIIDSQSLTFRKRVRQLTKASSPWAIHNPFYRSAKAIFITLKGAKRVGCSEECD